MPLRIEEAPSSLALSGATASAAPQRPQFGLRERLVALVGRVRAALKDQRGSQITDNLALIVIGIVAVVAIGGLISGLDHTVFSWVTSQLGVGS